MKHVLFAHMAKGRDLAAPNPADPALVLTDPDRERWTAETDVVVVGFGGAGACAALEAKAQGAQVLVLDRFHGGGATAISGGVFYSGGGTHIQRQAGVEDDAEQMFRYLSLEVQDVVSAALLRDFCERSADNLRWLEGHGVPFEASLCPVKTSYPTDDYYLYYSGNESFPPYKDSAKPAPRGHRAKGTGLPGANFYEPLRESAHAAGIDVEYEARVSRLIIDGKNRVLGVEYKRIRNPVFKRLHRKMHQAGIAIVKYNPGLAAKLRRRCNEIEASHSETCRVRARRGVILSAGGFIYNRAMVQEHAPAYRRGMPLGTASDNGSGILLGESIGGETDRMDRVSAWRFINPPEAFAQGMIINKKGERYINEFMYGAAIGEAMVDRNDGAAFLIIDKSLKKRAREQCKPGQAQWFQRAPALLNLWFNTREAQSVEELAKMLRIPAAALHKTLDAYNDAADGKKPDAFGKDPNKMHAMREGPYYVIDASFTSKRFPCPTLTLGGLVVDEGTGQVRGKDGKLIAGLYAAGRNAVGICSRQYVSGLSIADCVYSGRRAGRAAATGETATGSLKEPDPEKGEVSRSLPSLTEAQIADPHPEAHEGTGSGTRRSRAGTGYPRTPLQRSVRRAGTGSKRASQGSRIVKRGNR